ncbi:MAG TPA: HD domain-containing phosphohydrolase [Magnetospirillaceae bacterium]|nr:HD domain-containing phosphohydrolase [Magnetospirillaceae bacterium]
MTDRVLIIDDDHHLLSSFRRQLGTQFDLETAQGGSQGVDAVIAAQHEQKPFAVVVSDMRMPGMDGIETLLRIKEVAPDTVRMMLTGNADQQTAIDAVNQGQIFRFYSKPTSPEYLANGLRSGAEQYKLVTAERELLEKTLSGSINLLCDVMSLNDPFAARISARLRDYVRRLITEFKMPQRWPLEIAATLAPLGKAMIPLELQAKMKVGAPLNEAEQSVVEQAPETARHLIANIPRLAKVAEIVYLQDRGYDGSGFPQNGPKGADIPLDARLLKILKDLAAIVESTGTANNQAFAEMDKKRAVYDPQLLAKVRLCLVRDSSAPPPNLLRIPLASLKAGHVMASDLRLSNGHLIFASGTPIGEPQLERLKALRRIFTFIEPIEVKDVIPRESA